MFVLPLLLVILTIDATLVCEQLGYYVYIGSIVAFMLLKPLDIAGGTAYSSTAYGAGSGPIYLTEVLCTSSKTHLLQCNSAPILSGGCSHSEDAGVKCEGIVL